MDDEITIGKRVDEAVEKVAIEDSGEVGMLCQRNKS